jgi:hypothetical protein
VVGSPGVWFLHETHSVRGESEEEFDALLRDAWIPRVAETADARVAHVLRHAHGTGPSYRLVTWTALADAAAYEALARDVARGPLRELAARLDGLRHDVEGKLLEPLPWSPLQQVDLAAVPAAGADHELTLYMEDTVAPREGKLEEYVERSGAHYAREMAGHERAGRAMLQVQGGFRTVFGSGRRREIVLWQKVVDPRLVLGLLCHDVPADRQGPGTWMHDALALRDQWQSRLLRTTRWSPLA